MEHQHIILEGGSLQVNYESSGFPHQTIVDRGDAHVHSAILSQHYAGALAEFKSATSTLPNDVHPVNGVYLDITVDKSANNLNKFDSKTGAILMNVRKAENDNEDDITVFLPTENHRWLSSRLHQYDAELSEGENRKNAPLVNSISDVKCSKLHSFFTDEAEFLHIADGETEYELWISNDLYDAKSMESALDAIGVRRCVRNLVFNDVVIYMVVATKNHLNQIVLAVKGLTEIHAHRRPSVLTKAGSMREQDEWVELIKADTMRADRLSRVAILDSGVTNSHPLIEDFLTDDRCHSALLNGNKRDLRNHGTGLASLVLYGDLTDAIHHNGHTEVTSDLMSVKIIPGVHESATDPEMYAVVTEDAMVMGREDNAEILCSAVTTDACSKEGVASSTSAAIDQTLYNDGRCDAVLFISAGNIYGTDGVDYPDFLHVNAILDPAQTWNAITVGAYTEKTAIADARYNDAQVIAPHEGISPFSRTSTQWGRSLVKPEIMMEGGNGVLNGNDIDLVDDLSLVCADLKHWYASLTRLKPPVLLLLWLHVWPERLSMLTLTWIRCQ